MFGTSGIRGLYGKEINERLAMIVSNAFANTDMVVGRDIRKTGIPLSHAVFSGVTSAGLDVINLGIAPTPTVALATKLKGIRGIMITASHNPPEYNGFKFIDNGIEIPEYIEEEIETKYKNNDFSLSNWDETGKVVADNSYIAKHKEMIKKTVKIPGEKKPKVVVDSNGAGAVITPSLLEELGCEVISINNSLEKFACLQCTGVFAGKSCRISNCPHRPATRYFITNSHPLTSKF